MGLCHCDYRLQCDYWRVSCCIPLSWLNSELFFKVLYGPTDSEQDDNVGCEMWYVIQGLQNIEHANYKDQPTIYQWLFSSIFFFTIMRGWWIFLKIEVSQYTRKMLLFFTTQQTEKIIEDDTKGHWRWMNTFEWKLSFSRGRAWFLMLTCFGFSVSVFHDMHTFVKNVL